MQSVLWYTFFTPEDLCAHEYNADREQTPVDLDPEVAVILGETNLDEDKHFRLFLHLTAGEKQLRWLSILFHWGFKHTDVARELMVRRPNCCAKCALKYTMSLPGKWRLIL